MADKDFVSVDRQWITIEIDPHAIAHALRGELKESNDHDSKWHINMYYGSPRESGPVYVLKLHPEQRKVLLDIPGPLWRGHKTYFAGMKLRDILDVEFAEFTNPYTGIKETDVHFNGTSSSGMRANSIIVSSAGFRIGGDE